MVIWLQNQLKLNWRPSHLQHGQTATTLYILYINISAFSFQTLSFKYSFMQIIMLIQFNGKLKAFCPADQRCTSRPGMQGDAFIYPDKQMLTFIPLTAGTWSHYPAWFMSHWSHSVNIGWITQQYKFPRTPVAVRPLSCTNITHY